MTTAALIIACFVSGYVAGAVTGYFIGLEYQLAPIMDDPEPEAIRPAIIDMEYMDEISGKMLESSTSIYIEERPDGSARQFIIQNN